jgi:hypothetical protein
MMEHIFIARVLSAFPSAFRGLKMQVAQQYVYN